MFLTSKIFSVGVVIVSAIAVISFYCIIADACPTHFDKNDKNNMIHDDNVKIQNLKPYPTKRPSRLTTPKPTITTVTEPEAPLEQPAIKNFTIYSANNFKGHNATLSFSHVGECLALPWEFRNKVNSINTNGGCVILCDKLDCQGWCLRFKPGTPSHNRLRRFRFHKRPESALSC